MNKAILIGGGGHARVVLAVAQALSSFEVIGYTDVNDRGTLLGVPYLGTDDVLPTLFAAGKARQVLLGIGQVTLEHRRQIILESAESIGYVFPPVVARSAVVQPEVEIGAGTVVMEGCVVNTGTNIGRGVILNTRSSVDHDCRIGDFVHIAPGVTLSGSVHVGSHSIVGVGATIIQGKTICSRCYVGAGSVVVRDLTEQGVYAGIPARRAPRG